MLWYPGVKMIKFCRWGLGAILLGMLPGCSDNEAATDQQGTGGDTALGSGGQDQDDEGSGSGGSDNEGGTGGAGTGEVEQAGGESQSGSATGGSADDAGGSSTGGTGEDVGGGAGASGESTGWELPPGNAPFDYQIGGAYEPPPGVMIVSRDRESSPAEGLYNICYVNGFQTQPQDNDSWLRDRADLLVPGSDGDPLLDEDWGEYLLDISTEDKRARLLDVVRPWLEGCAEDGFDAIEVDNLDSFTRSNAYLTRENAISYLAGMSAIAHELGLAIGQKNSAELLDSVDAMGTDFVVAEECNRYNECGDFQAVYQDRVFIIEYRQQDFDAGCNEFPELSIVLRDLNVSGPGANSYVYEGC